MNDESGPVGLVKGRQDLAAGIFLIALALLALWLGSNLNSGTLRAMGPGMVPRAVAVLMGLVGLALVIGAFLSHGPAIGRIPIRGPLFITLGIVAFGLTVRGFAIPLPGGFSLRLPALGLLGAGPLSILIGGLASEETDYKELILFAIVMTAFCWLLFKVGLNLPIPLAPILLVY